MFLFLFLAFIKSIDVCVKLIENETCPENYTEINEKYGFESLLLSSEINFYLINDDNTLIFLRLMFCNVTSLSVTGIPGSVINFDISSKGKIMEFEWINITNVAVAFSYGSLEPPESIVTNHLYVRHANILNEAKTITCGSSAKIDLSSMANINGISSKIIDLQLDEVPEFDMILNTSSYVSDEFYNMRIHCSLEELQLYQAEEGLVLIFPNARQIYIRSTTLFCQFTLFSPKDGCFLGLGMTNLSLTSWSRSFFVLTISSPTPNFLLNSDYFKLDKLIFQNARMTTENSTTAAVTITEYSIMNLSVISYLEANSENIVVTILSDLSGNIIFNGTALYSTTGMKITNYQNISFSRFQILKDTHFNLRISRENYGSVLNVEDEYIRKGTVYIAPVYNASEFNISKKEDVNSMLNKSILDICAPDLMCKNYKTVSAKTAQGTDPPVGFTDEDMSFQLFCSQSAKKNCISLQFTIDPSLFQIKVCLSAAPSKLCPNEAVNIPPAAFDAFIENMSIYTKLIEIYIGDSSPLSNFAFNFDLMKQQRTIYIRNKDPNVCPVFQIKLTPVTGTKIESLLIDSALLHFKSESKTESLNISFPNISFAGTGDFDPNQKEQLVLKYLGSLMFPLSQSGTHSYFDCSNIYISNVEIQNITYYDDKWLFYDHKNNQYPIPVNVNSNYPNVHIWLDKLPGDGDPFWIYKDPKSNNLHPLIFPLQADADSGFMIWFDKSFEKVTDPVVKVQFDPVLRYPAIYSSTQNVPIEFLRVPSSESINSDVIYLSQVELDDDNISYLSVSKPLVIDNIGISFLSNAYFLEDSFYKSVPVQFTSVHLKSPAYLMSFALSSYGFTREIKNVTFMSNELHISENNTAVLVAYQVNNNLYLDHNATLYIFHSILDDVEITYTASLLTYTPVINHIHTYRFLPNFGLKNLENVKPDEEIVRPRSLTVKYDDQNVKESNINMTFINESQFLFCTHLPEECNNLLTITYFNPQYIDMETTRILFSTKCVFLRNADETIACLAIKREITDKPSPHKEGLSTAVLAAIITTCAVFIGVATFLVIFFCWYRHKGISDKSIESSLLQAPMDVDV